MASQLRLSFPRKFWPHTPEPLAPIWRDLKHDPALQRKLKQLHRSQRNAIIHYIGAWRQPWAARLHHQLKVRLTGRMNAWSQANLKPGSLGLADHAEAASWRRDLTALITQIERHGWTPLCDEYTNEKRRAQRMVDQAEITWRQASVLQWINGDRSYAKRDHRKYATRLLALEAKSAKLTLLARYYAPPLHLMRGV